jgi:hypothetical protein
MQRALLIPLIVALLAALAGCGSGGSSAGVEDPSAGPRETAKIAREAEATAPKEASPTLKGVYRSFQRPRTEAMEPEVANAVEKGETACAAKTPIAVREEFFAAAKATLEPEQLKLIGQIGKFEADEKNDQSFVAGQLAADVYAATLYDEEAQGGYQGCVYALAQALEKRLAPR